MKGPQLLASMGLAAYLALSRSAEASCECVLVVEGADFRARCYQTCGYEDTSYSEVAWRGVTECHARALRFAANLWKRLQHDPAFRSLAGRTPLIFEPVYGWSDTLGRHDWQAPPGLRPATVDSLLGVFREIDRARSATVFTVRLGLFVERSRAEARWRDLHDLRPPNENPDYRDPAFTVDWRLSTCAYTARPNLFVLPDGAGAGPWRVCYGLFLDRGDAARAAYRLRRARRMSTVIQALPFSRDLLQAAVSQWHVRGMTDTD